MSAPWQDPRRICLKVADWPEPDRLSWQEGNRSGHILDDAGAAAHWSQATRHKYRRGYGRWLGFLEQEQPDLLILPSPNRVMATTVRAFHQFMETQSLAPVTIVHRIAELHAVIAALAPDRDWRWLAGMVTRLRRGARPVKNKRSRIRPSRDLFDWSLDRMGQVHGDPSLRPLPKAAQFRDALMIALLAARPLRRNNFTSIRIGHHLHKPDGNYLLAFEAHETKNRQPLDFPVPSFLTAFLDLYLEHHRPCLLGNTDTDQLWVSSRGNPMTDMAVYHRVTSVTRWAFGTAINPHLFRDCAATSIAIEDPEHVHIAAVILGHGNLKTTERHYNQARSLEAGRLYQQVITNLRKTIPRPHSTSGQPVITVDEGTEEDSLPGTSPGQSIARGLSTEIEHESGSPPRGED